MANELERLPRLIRDAAAALAKATTAAEILEAQQHATIAYGAAKLAARFTKVKDAHDTVLAACHRAQADALIIEARAQCRLAEEYEAAQERGELAKNIDGYRLRVLRAAAHDCVQNQNTIATVTEIGLTRRQTFEARAIRDAERVSPGIISKALNECLATGKAPTRAAMWKAVESVHGRGQQGTVKPAYSPKPRQVNPKEEKIIVLSDSGVPASEIAEEVGVVTRAVHRVLKEEDIRRNTEPQITPDMLSMSAQEKLALAIRQATRRLEIEIEQRIRKEWEQRIEETILPAYNESYAKYNDHIKWARRKGIMDKATFQKIRSRLHPDVVHALGETAMRLNEEAFVIFNRLTDRLLSEAEEPTPTVTMPSTVAELLKMKEQVVAARRAARQSRGNGSVA